MMRSSSLILALLALSGCAETAVPSCVPIVTYTADQQKQAAAELRSMPPDAETPKMMVDYGKLRAEERACAGK